MAIREVVKLPEPILRKKSHKVTQFDDGFQKLVDDMIATMRDEPGVGLAAPQVNVSLRLIVVEYPEDDSNEQASAKLFVVANPKFSEMSEERVMGLEGCLSVPNIIGDVERANEVTVKGLNRYGKKQTIKAKGWLARIFQHEIDHLNGVLFVDRAKQLYKSDKIQSEKMV